MYQIKAYARDFVVEEIPDVQVKDQGAYTCFWLEKRNLNTLDAIHRIAHWLHLDSGFFGFAGTKDKKAMTKQVCSVKGDFVKALNHFEQPDLKVTVLGYCDEPVSLGQLKGNRFKVTVRNLEHRPHPMMVFVNYFGEQRFGKDNVTIGKHIVLGDIDHAVLLFLKTISPYQEDVMKFLEEHPREYVGAMHRIPMKLLRLFIHSYQSKMWNEIVQQLVDSKDVISNIRVPLIGFGLAPSTKYRKYIQPILDREQIKPRDFVIKSFPQLSSEGGLRRVFAEVKELKIGECESDELNKGKVKVVLSFVLSPGCYATVFLHQLFGKFGKY